MPITLDELEEFDMINYQLLALNAKAVIKKIMGGEYQGKILPQVIYRVLGKAKHFIAQIQVGALRGSPSRYSERLLPTLEATWIAEYGKRTWREYFDGGEKIPVEKRVESYIVAIEAIEKRRDLNEKDEKARSVRKNLEEVARFFGCIYEVFGKDLDEITVRASET